METDIMRMQREAEQRVRQMRERERHAAGSEPDQRTAEGLAAARAEWLSSARPSYAADRGFVPLSDYKARQNPRHEPPPCPVPERPLPADNNADSNGLLAGLFKDQDQMLLLFLTILLVKNGASMELIIALLYLAM